MCAVAIVASSWLCISAQNLDVSGRIEATHQSKRAPHASLGDVVVWLTPLQMQPEGTVRRSQEYTLTQKDKMFHPHLLVVPVGSNVNFPNLDPFFHNVFSLFNGKRFDLGLYEAHTHRSVLFDREGVSYIFCNIHPNMGAVIVSLSTPYYGVSKADGSIVVHDVPPGRYRLSVWGENVGVERLAELSRVVEIGPESTDLGVFRLEFSGDVMNHHQNKFGESYPPTVKQPY